MSPPLLSLRQQGSSALFWSPPCTAHYFFIKKNNLGQYRGGGKKTDPPGVGTPGTQQSLDTAWWGPPPSFKHIKIHSSFPDIIPQERPLVLYPKIPDPYWLAGFATGEGCFFAGITGSSTHRLGFQVRLAFELAQHSRDEQLIKSIINYFDCGKIYKKNKKVFNYRVVKYSDLENKIIPFFLKYKLEGVKYKDFQDFLQIAELMKNKVHLTQKGLEQIRKIKNGMNSLPPPPARGEGRGPAGPHRGPPAGGRKFD